MAVVNFDRTYVEIALGQTGQQFWVSVEGLPESGFGYRLQPRHTDNLEVSAPACGGLFNGSLKGGAGETEGVIDIECTFEHEQLFAQNGRMLRFMVTRLRGGPGWVEFTSEAGPRPIIYSTPAVQIEFGGALQIAEPSRPGAPRLHLGAAHGGDRRERARDLRPRLTAVWRCEDVAAVRAEVEAQAARLRVVIVRQRLPVRALVEMVG